MSKGITLPESIPQVGDPHDRYAAWVSEAVKQTVLGSWRPSRAENAGLVVRLKTSREIVFSSINEANRPERFIAAFMSPHGVVMPSYSAPQIRLIVGALIRMAAIEDEEDDRTAFASTGSDYLQGCLHNAGKVTTQLDNNNAAFYAAARYRDTIAALTGDPLDPWPSVLIATDRRVLHIPRRLFYVYARRHHRALDQEFLRMQMTRLGWESVDLQPRPPKTVQAARPRVRLWGIPDGWDGVSIDQPAADSVETPGDAETPGDGLNARARSRARDLDGTPGVSTSPGRGPSRTRR